jgi:hypothetical protein
MPSTKDPVTTVQPGPGHLPDGTVSANALDFNPAAGANASLQAHITNPTAAHAATAISTTALTGATWNSAVSNVQAALTRAFEGVNSRAVWVLDANPANKADFVGPSALINAIAAMVPSTQSMLYLRPGIYNWADGSIFSAVTIIGGGSPATATQAEIHNLAGDIRVGGGVTFTNVVLRCSGNLNIQGAIGYNTFQSVELDVTGVLAVSSTNNRFTQVSPVDTTPLFLNETAGSNSFNQCIFSQLSTTTGAGGNSFSDIVVGAGNALKNPGSPVVVASNANVATNLTINTSGATTGSSLVVTGNDNVFNRVNVQGTTPTGKFVEIGGSRTSMNGLNINGTSGSSVGLFISGHANRVADVAFDTMASYAASLITMSSATACTVESVQAQAISVTAGAGFQLLNMVSSIACEVRAVRLTNCPSLGTSTALVKLDGCAECLVADMLLSTLGSTSALAAPFLAAGVGANTGVTIERINFVSVLVAGSGTYTLFDVDCGLWLGLRLGAINCPVSSPGTQAHIYNGTGLDVAAVRLDNCRFANPAAASLNTVYVELCLNRVEILSCYIAGSDVASSAPAFRVSNSRSVYVVDSYIEGLAGAACTSFTSGTTFVNTKFSGGGTAGSSTGIQLFAGYGGSTVGPLKISNCEMRIAANNIQSGGVSTQPIVFLGGAGVSSTSHGAIIVDGLLIKKDGAVSLPFWHKAPTLAIDTKNQSPSTESSFKDIIVDLQGIPFTGDANNTSVFGNMSVGSGLNTKGAIIEIQGSDVSGVPYIARFQNLALVNLPRAGGGGNRCAIKAQGCTIDNLIVDAVNTGTPANWIGATVALRRVHLTSADLYPTTSIPHGASSGYAVPIYAEFSSIVSKAKIRNLNTADGYSGVVALSESTLENSLIEVQGGVAVGQVGSGMIFAVDDSWVVDNQIICNHAATNAADTTYIIRGDGNNVKIRGNTLKNVIVPTGAGYPNIGGGVTIEADNDNVWVEDNYLEYEWKNGTLPTPSVAPIRITGSFNHVNNNTLINRASTGGWVTLSVVGGGKYTNVTGNLLKAFNVNDGNIFIEVNAATRSTVMNNRLINLNGTEAIIVSGATDLPAGSAMDDFNQTSNTP